MRRISPYSWLALTLVAAVVTVTLWRGEIARTVSLYPTALPPHPRLVLDFDRAALLYVIVPLTVVATIVLILAPGALVMLLRSGRERAGELLLKAFAAGFGLRVILHAVCKLLGLAVTPAVFGWIEAAMLTSLGLTVWIRARRSALVSPAWLSGPERGRLLRLLAIPYVFVALCTPEIFWKDLIGDGFETLYSGFALSGNIVPRFSTPSGFYGIGLGLMSQAYPLSWFGNVFGYTEAAARLPLALYAMLIAAGVIALGEWKGARTLRWSEDGAIALGVGGFVATLGFNSSYHSYVADFAAPLAVEALTVLAMLGLIFMWWSRQHLWLLAFVALGAFNRPNVLLVLCALAVATVVVRHDGWRRALSTLALAVVFCLVLGAVYEKLYLARATSLPVEGLDGSVLRRVRYLQFTEIRRLLYLLLPSGILPALALLAYRRQDGYARQISILVGLYFAFFYVEAYYSLHHFAPIMVLPLVVFWRLRAAGRFDWRLSTAAAAGAVVAIAVAFPWGQPIPRQTQLLARHIDFRLSRIDPVAIGAKEFAERRGVLAPRFPPQSAVDDLTRTWGFDLHALAYYAHRASDLKTHAEDISYRVLDRSAPPPAGWQQVATTDSLAGFVRDSAVLERQLADVPSINFANPIYRIRREQLLRYLGVPKHIHELDLRDVPSWIAGLLKR